MIASILMSSVAGAAAWVPGDDPDFARDVAPILERHCFECHGAAVQKAGLRLDQRAAALAGSDFGAFPVIEPGASTASYLIEVVERGEMPPDGRSSLSAAEVETLARWIDAGAPWPDDGQPALWPTQHWAYAPPERPPVPEVGADGRPSNPIDAFLDARHAAAGLVRSDRAPRSVRLRRAALDLTGLPPSEADVAAFLKDDAPGAWERAVERLLDSPHYGEQQARHWLDLARYADSNGYEQDGDRSMWPWRDWVIDAFNADLPFDQFTIQQFAGDLLPDATLEERLATGFHRNTMTNQEGGTDAEEFRVAAVVDRVNTTGEVWLGTTMGCAQCHDHKYDPITQRDYYRLFAALNQTADDGKYLDPTIAVPSPEQAARIGAIDAEVAEIEGRLAAWTPEQEAELARWTARVRGLLDGSTPLERSDAPWFEGVRPAAEVFEGHWATVASLDGGAQARTRGSLLAQQAEGYTQDVFRGARIALEPVEGDRLFAWVWIDPGAPTRQLLLQWHVEGEGWEHRAYFGEDLHGWGEPGTSARHRAGDLPPAGEWARLEIDAAAVGIGPEMRVDGFSMGCFGGRVAWDAAGLWTANRFLHAGVSPEIADALLDALDDQQPDSVRRWYREGLPEFDLERARLAALEAERPTPPTSLVLARVEQARTTHVLDRGSFLAPREEVTPAVPSVLDPERTVSIEDRLDLARWLVARDNPLTARVAVNRLWQQMFGRGLVATPDDFGTRGAPPSNPALLDWLAVEFIESGWRTKAMLRLIATSQAYQRSSTRTPEQVEHDPDGELLACFPRRRLSGEELRDQALALAGTLVTERGGPPVYPPQPAGTDNGTYAGDRWRTSSGADAHRRSLYTFWRRTSPYPTFLLFDAPSRELSCARRDDSNTPLQALALLNDPTFVEAADAFGERLAEIGVARGFAACTGREPDDRELAVLDELAASDGWSAAAQVLLNLDETVTRP
jgi:hypothetical protein